MFWLSPPRAPFLVLEIAPAFSTICVGLINLNLHFSAAHGRFPGLWIWTHISIFLDSAFIHSHAACLPCCVSEQLRSLSKFLNFTPGWDDRRQKTQKLNYENDEWLWQIQISFLRWHVIYVLEHVSKVKAGKERQKYDEREEASNIKIEIRHKMHINIAFVECLLDRNDWSIICLHCIKHLLILPKNQSTAMLGDPGRVVLFQRHRFLWPRLSVMQILISLNSAKGN